MKKNNCEYGLKCSRPGISVYDVILILLFVILVGFVYLQHEDVHQIRQAQLAQQVPQHAAFYIQKGEINNYPAGFFDVAAKEPAVKEKKKS